mgnify:CR=1 FL=1
MSVEYKQVKRRKKRSIYIDRVKLSEEVTKDALRIREALEKKQEIPQISNYVAESIYKIVTHLAFSGNFKGYTFREDMIGDAIVHCVASVKNFDPVAKTRDGKPNAFAYFTQVSYYAFLQRIHYEKEQWAKMAKIKSSLTIWDVASNDALDPNEQATQILNAFVEECSGYVIKNSQKGTNEESD